MRGWRKPIDALFVGRPGKWGNPYKVGRGQHTAEEALMLFRRDLIAGSLKYAAEDVRRELKGKDLVCWVSVARRTSVSAGVKVVGS